MSEYSVRNVVPGQALTERHSNLGDIRWIPATAHMGENMGSTEMRGLIVELKDPVMAMNAEQKAALASFQAMLDGLGKRDKAAMMAQLLPGGSAILMRNGKPAQMTFEVLTDRLSQPGKETHEERIHDAVVHIDGDVGTVWAPFEFLVNGKIDIAAATLRTWSGSTAAGSSPPSRTTAGRTAAPGIERRAGSGCCR